MRILIAEDNPDTAWSYKIALEKRNHEVLLTYSGEECLKAYHDALKGMPRSNSSPFDTVVLDYKLDYKMSKDGMEVAREILALNPDQRIIVASAYVEKTLLDSIKQLRQVVELIPKPFELDAFVETIEDKEKTSKKTAMDIAGQ